MFINSFKTINENYCLHVQVISYFSQAVKSLKKGDRRRTIIFVSSMISSYWHQGFFPINVQMFPTKLGDKKFECNLTKVRIRTKPQSAIMVSFTNTLWSSILSALSRERHIWKNIWNRTYFRLHLFKAWMVVSTIWTTRVWRKNGPF